MYLDQHTHFFLHEPRLLFRGPGDGAADRFLSHTPVEGVAQLPDSPDHPQFRQLVQRLLQEANVFPPPHQDEPAPPTQEELDRRAVSELKNLRHQEGDVRRRAVRFLLQWMRGKSPQDLTDLTRHARHAEDLDELRRIVARPEIQESHQYSFKKIATMIQINNGFLRDVWRVVFEDRVKAEALHHGGSFAVLQQFLQEPSLVQALEYFPWHDLTSIGLPVPDASKILPDLQRLSPHHERDAIIMRVAAYLWYNGVFSSHDLKDILDERGPTTQRHLFAQQLLLMAAMSYPDQGNFGHLLGNLYLDADISADVCMQVIAALFVQGRWISLQLAPIDLTSRVFESFSTEERLTYEQRMHHVLLDKGMPYFQRERLAHFFYRLTPLSPYIQQAIAAYFHVAFHRDTQPRLAPSRLRAHEIVRSIAEDNKDPDQRFVPRLCRTQLLEYLSQLKRNDEWKKQSIVEVSIDDSNLLRYLPRALTLAGCPDGLLFYLEHAETLMTVLDTGGHKLSEKNFAAQEFIALLQLLEFAHIPKDASQRIIEYIRSVIRGEKKNPLIEVTMRESFFVVLQHVSTHDDLKLAEEILIADLRKNPTERLRRPSDLYFRGTFIQSLEAQFGGSLEAALPEDLRRIVSTSPQIHHTMIDALSNEKYHSEQWNDTLNHIFYNKEYTVLARCAALNNMRPDRASLMHSVELLSNRHRISAAGDVQDWESAPPKLFVAAMEKICRAYQQNDPAVDEALLVKAMDAYIAGLRVTDDLSPIAKLTHDRLLDFFLKHDVIARLIGHYHVREIEKVFFLQEISLRALQHPAFKRALVAAIYDTKLLEHDVLFDFYDTSFTSFEGFEKLPEIVLQHKDHPSLTTDCLARLAFANGWPQIAQVLVDIHRGTTLPEDRQQSLARQLRALSEKYPHLTDLATYIRQNNALGK